MRLVAVHFTLGLILAAVLFAWFSSRFHSLHEQWLKQDNVVLRTAWKGLDMRVEGLRKRLDQIIDKEDHVYRIILDSPMLSEEERQAGAGGRQPTYLDDINYPFIETTLSKMERFSHQLDVEIQSLDQVSVILADKQRMWHSRPAIQPIANDQLDHLYTTFGIRFHPIINIYREHKGLDFAAPLGTPVFATGDGHVLRAYRSISYGNVVFINHDYGYQTRYAHMSSYIVEDGQEIKRGQVIGYVGDTGLSRAPHLHYEVLYHNEQINPINFFQHDLSNEEYQKLIDKANDTNPSLDY